ncbi:cytochrome P450 [Streptomyces pseudovenezuelae]|uniref:cytochrome P450 n=1 Tax=Streptomyces pseudovenezuelae TaxID=67350 RepID=UPI002E8022DF|nr:cytochrome P450 [Streptomyces pseudovenezuelae]WUA85901.1 cytochrome P450 [Streptomyces pseudovenezuelae]
MSISVTEAGVTLADPAAYADDERLHRALRLLRRSAPVHRVEAPGYNPFWAITRHADIREIERRNDVFLSEPRPMLIPARQDALGSGGGKRELLRPLAHLDDLEHRQMRSVTAPRFTPQAITLLGPRIRDLARRTVDRLARRTDVCEFVGEVTDVYALQVLLVLLGLDDSDAEEVRPFTPAARRSMPPEQRTAAMRRFYHFFLELVADRRRHPTGDLASVIANARVDGRPLDDHEVLSQFVIIVAAGHDTASVTLAGGLQALIENPSELRALREDPSLLPTAVEEMIRWVTPVKAFMRTARRDHELGGVLIRAGEAVLLSYPSANRDEAVFDDPYRFDVRRTPNRQLAFGFGVHHCLGASLARLEIESFFTELLPRLVSAECVGYPVQLTTTFSGGLKRFPVRCVLTD